jgi:ubiquinone/menaquinone biosynthesis C-methylase UbiE
MTGKRASGRTDERDELFSYYEARADEYDDFYQGKGQAVPELSAEYPIDTAAVSELLGKFGQGDVVDLACGTGFWLTAYGANCRSVTLVDQSTAVLGRCQRRVHELGLHRVATLVQGDLFDVPLPKHGFDACLLGFLLSHLTDSQTDALFDRLRAILRPDSTVAVVDSSWSTARQPYRQRDGFEERVLPNGRSFTIRKRYFSRDHLAELIGQQGFQIRSSYVGNVFLAAITTRAD